MCKLNIHSNELELKVLGIIKEESENADIRKYTCTNAFGYSEYERKIARRVVELLSSSKKSLKNKKWN